MSEVPGYEKEVRYCLTKVAIRLEGTNDALLHCTV